MSVFQLDYLCAAADVTLSGVRHFRMIQVLISPRSKCCFKQFRRRMRSYCRDKLARFKIPQKVEVVSESMQGSRFKKMRRQ